MASTLRMARSLQWDEGTLAARPAMPDRLVGDREFGKVVANHLWLDLDVDVLLAVVYADHAANHLRHYHHVAQVGLHCLRLFAVGGLALCLPELLQQRDGAPLDAAAEFAALACTEEFHEILVAHVQELVKVHTAVGILAEGALLRLVLVTHPGLRLRLSAYNPKLRAVG